MVLVVLTLGIQGTIIVSFDQNGQIEISLTRDEQQIILGECRGLDADLLRKISLTLNGRVYLTSVELGQLIESISHVLSRTKDITVDDLYVKLLTYFPDRVMESNEKETLTDSIGTITELINYNHTPNPELGDLSPYQASQLIDADWNEKDCPLRFNHDLTFAQVNQVVFFRNARRFLKLIRDNPKADMATDRGNLNRHYVKILLDQLEIDEDARNYVLKYNKVINEADVREIHVLKLVCSLAGLIINRGKRFVIPQQCQPLLTDDLAGELYYRLFEAYFKRFNLGYCDGFPEFEGIQATIGYILYRISVMADKRMKPSELFDLTILPAVREAISQAKLVIKDMGNLLAIRLLRHLEMFRLLDCEVQRKEFYYSMVSVGKSPLYDQFIRITF